MSEDRPSQTASRSRLGLKKRLVRIALAVASLWVLQLVDTLQIWGDLARFGIVPRTVDGLRGIPFAPFLHEGFGHLATNTLPLFALAALVSLRGMGSLATVTLLVTVASGFATWALARGGAPHLGASGLVFGYLGFLLTAGIVERSVRSLAIAALTVALYGSLLWGVLPTQPNVSWEGHLFGFGAGILVGRYGPVRPPREGPS